MPDNRTGRREDRRAFRPTLDGTLETRLLMAASAIRAQTAAGGQAVVVTIADGSKFFVSVDNGGTVRATAASGGRVNLIVDGTNSGSLLEVNRILPKRVQGSAHTFNSALAGNTTRLNIASVTVSSGVISAIEGYQTANLSGPIVVAGSTRVDRIALGSILPGGSIAVSGDLNTLDVYSGVTLSGANITVGRDLNWFETYGNVSLTNNAKILVGRDLGQTLQPAKGTGNLGQGLFVGGNLSIDSTSFLTVTRNIPLGVIGNGAGVLINGNFSGVSRFSVAGSTPTNPTSAFAFANVSVLGTISA